MFVLNYLLPICGLRRAGDIALCHGDEGLDGVAQRREPLSAIEQVGVFQRDELFVVQRLAVQREFFNALMRRAPIAFNATISSALPSALPLTRFEMPYTKTVFSRICGVKHTRRSRACENRTRLLWHWMHLLKGYTADYDDGSGFT